MQVRQSLAVEMSKENMNGNSLGIMQGFRSLGNILGFLIVPILFLILSKLGFGRDSAKSYKAIYFIAMLIAFVAYIFTSKIPKLQSEEKVGPKIYFS